MIELSKGTVLPNRIVVKEVKTEETKTTSGIIIPDVQKRPVQCVGDVLLTGEGTPKEEMKVQVGMRVIYPYMSGQKFYLDEDRKEELLLIPQSSVLFMYYPTDK